MTDPIRSIDNARQLAESTASPALGADGLIDAYRSGCQLDSAALAQDLVSRIEQNPEAAGGLIGAVFDQLPAADRGRLAASLSGEFTTTYRLRIDREGRWSWT